MSRSYEYKFNVKTTLFKFDKGVNKRQSFFKNKVETP